MCKDTYFPDMVSTENGLKHIHSVSLYCVYTNKQWHFPSLYAGERAIPAMRYPPGYTMIDSLKGTLQLQYHNIMYHEYKWFYLS